MNAWICKFTRFVGSCNVEFKGESLRNIGVLKSPDPVNIHPEVPSPKTHFEEVVGGKMNPKFFKTPLCVLSQKWLFMHFVIVWNFREREGYTFWGYVSGTLFWNRTLGLDPPTARVRRRVGDNDSLMQGTCKRIS